MRIKQILAFLALSLYLMLSATAFAQSLPSNKWFKVGDKTANFVEIRLPKYHVKFRVRTDPSVRNPYMASILWPPGVDLPLGTTWQIDNTKSLRVPFLQCRADSCLAQVIINTKYIAALRTGNTYHIGASQNGKKRSIDLPLKGFTAAYNGKELMSFEEYTKAGGNNMP